MGFVALGVIWNPTIQQIAHEFLFVFVTMAVSCNLFETKRDIGRKTPIFHTAVYLTCTIPKNPSNFAQN